MQRPSEPIDVRANATPTELNLSAPVEITAARAGDGEDEPRRPRFSILGYTGAPMSIGGFYSPLVLDLSGLKAERQQIPALRDHDPGRIVGQTDAITIDAEGVRLEGQFTGVRVAADESLAGDNADARQIVSLSKDGFRWEASVGASIVRQEYLKPGEKATLNGREVAGPMILVRESRLREISFVALGADSQTSADVAASNPSGSTHLGNAMTFDEWVKAKGFDPAALTDQQKTFLRAAFDEEQRLNAAANNPSPQQQPPSQPNGVTADGRKTLDQIMAEARKEDERVAEITRITAQAIQDRPALIDEFERMAKAAIDAKTSPLEYELHVLRASRSAPGVIVRRNDGASEKVVEAAVCLSGGLKDPEKHFGEKVLNAAEDRFKHGLGLRDLLLIAARENGYQSTTTNDLEGLLRAAFARTDVRASGGFSTLSLSGILGNVANKFLRRGFDSIETGWNRIAAIRSVRDFKQTTSYTLTGGFTFEQVGPAGEIKHATVGSESYTNQADTYGRMFAITRRDIINDDLGALTEVPFRIGRGAALKLNTVFWTEFLADVTTFFTTGRGNYFEGSTTNLQSSSLKTATEYFRRQTDPDGNPLGVAPRLLVVPPELEITADELMTSTVVNTGGSSTTDKVPNRNVWQSKYETVMSTYLSNSSITNYSTTHWFLLADPMDLPLIEVAFLNGRQQPSVESADAEFNTLGIQMRGYFDFGVNKQEYRAGVRSKGAA